MTIITRVKSFLADLVTVVPDPTSDYEEPVKHIKMPNLIALMCQLGTVVSLHRHKAGHSDIDIVVHDGDAMRSLIATLNDQWVDHLNAPPELAAGLRGTGDIIKIETDDETQRARIGGIYLHWPAPGVEWEAIQR